MTDFFQVNPCKGTHAYTVIPKKQMKLDLQKQAGKFDDVYANTPLILIIKYKGFEISIHPAGKLLVKSSDKDKVKKMAEEIYERIASP